MKSKSKSVSKKIMKRIIKCRNSIKEILGDELCVCFLTHGHTPSLMISNIKKSSFVEEVIIQCITNIIFPHMEFEISQRDLGCSHGVLVFTPSD